MADDKARDTGRRDDQSVATDQSYVVGDVEAVYRMSNPRSWHQLVRWLSEQGDLEYPLDNTKVKRMVEDFRTLDERGVPFTTDARHAWERAHEARNNPS